MRQRSLGWVRFAAVAGLGFACFQFPGQLQGQWANCPGGSPTCTNGDIKSYASYGMGFIMQTAAWSGGWAGRGFSFTNENDTLLAQFSAYGGGTPNVLNYAYIGIDYNSPWMTFRPSGNVGIGTTAPGMLLHVRGGPASDGGRLMKLESSTATGAGMSFVNSAKQANPWQIFGTGTQLKIGEDGVADWMTFAAGTGNIGIGVAPVAGAKLAVNGTIKTTEVVVMNPPFADYVFDAGYRLRPLGEVAEFIRENHHLPEIPSAAEVGANGVGLGEMQAKLLAKVEELTLHLIEADKLGKRLELENSDLRRMSGEMFSRIMRLELGTEHGGRP